ncbi:hypothetical protein [Streptomyces sp. DH12]|uniref:hypothetical protein n=1 Tax=Streptomyces sp. DH12 TaxID=2857010 RepID=UPI001E372B10|nr:hypothetical protein [Streptomyces sp. DH12]
MSTGDDSTAARQLRLLQNEYVQPGRQGAPTPRPRQADSSPPCRLGIVELIQASFREVRDTVRADVPDAAPPPDRADGVYAWAIDQTAHLKPERQLAHAAMVYRQSLEHAIAMRDFAVIRQHPCPACGTWGLFWEPASRQVVCVNHYCTDDQGKSRSWPLRYLAHRHVAAEAARKNRNVSAT